ncbi:Pycsar system effector family protein [Streptomyces sp. 769]|uniref:Pycsar system effector family protein n=1 Tax=Streptomyces sp. 769 TaxID=1262452 RepID=UPI001EEFFCF5|nr:Pycsar system effector family protein [Streptomyces sp. 769]
MTESQVPGLRTAERLIVDLRSEIARADNKAAVLVAGLGVTVGALTGSLSSAEWCPWRLPVAADAAWWCGCVAWAAALGLLLLAVAPRYGRVPWSMARGLTYFRDIRCAVVRGQLEEALHRTERDPLPGLLSLLDELSVIAAAKHRCIRWGLGCFAVGAVAFPVMLLLD